LNRSNFRRAETVLFDGRVALNLKEHSQETLLGCVNLGNIDVFMFGIISQPLPFRSEVLAMTAPRGIAD
jgi:hypothetical protein